MLKIEEVLGVGGMWVATIVKIARRPVAEQIEFAQQ